MINNFKQKLFDYLNKHESLNDDASHDLGHLLRVHKTAEKIALFEPAAVDQLILLAAAYLHDIVNLPKNHADAKLSSLLSANKARDILTEMSFPQDKIEPVCHAIHAHSFSAGIEPKTLEAKILQDADRMESLGALGVLRTFYVSGLMGSQPYHPDDLHGNNRPLDDKKYALDHFYCKLFKLPQLLNTDGARRIAEKRTEFLERFIVELSDEIPRQPHGAHAVIEACYKAFEMKKKLFHERDPFAVERLLNEDHYVVDELQKKLPSYPIFITLFLDQLKEELL